MTFCSHLPCQHQLPGDKILSTPKYVSWGDGQASCPDTNAVSNVFVNHSDLARKEFQSPVPEEKQSQPDGITESGSCPSAALPTTGILLKGSIT